MSWSPNLNFEDLDDTIESERYGQLQDINSTTSLRPKAVTLELVDEEHAGWFEHRMDAKKINSVAVDHLRYYCKKFGVKIPKARQWVEGQKKAEAEDFEITKLIREIGIEREPSSNYRPNSTTTSRSAIPMDKLPVIGVKNRFLSRDYFAFKNPYFKAEPDNVVNNVKH